MIRFVEMKGIHLGNKKSFGFYNTVTDSFLTFDGSSVFDNVYEFKKMYQQDCGYDYERLKSLIPEKWVKRSIENESKQMPIDNPDLKPDSYHSNTTTGGKEFIISKAKTDYLKWKLNRLDNDKAPSENEIQEMGNEALLKRFRSQEKADEFINNGFTKIMERLEKSGHLPKDDKPQ